MRIRVEQVAMLDEAATTDLHNRLAIYLRRNLPELTNHLKDTELRERIAAAALRAKKYGVKTDIGIAEFVSISFVAGEKFDELPDIHRYLTQPSIDPDLKVRLLAKELVSNLENRKSAGS